MGDYTIKRVKIIDDKYNITDYSSLKKDDKVDVISLEESDIQSVTSKEVFSADNYVEIGKKAYNGDKEAMEYIVDLLSRVVKNVSDVTGVPSSMLIAQIIQETGWLSFPSSHDNSIVPGDNNILGMNYYMDREVDGTLIRFESILGEPADRVVPQEEDDGNWVYGTETMAKYSSMEDCVMDYVLSRFILRPDVWNMKDKDSFEQVILGGYATDSSYRKNIYQLIDDNDLTKYDSREFHLTDDIQGLIDKYKLKYKDNV